MSLVQFAPSESNLKSPSLQVFNRNQPQSKREIEDEWSALLKHQHEIYDAIAQYDRDLKYLKQCELGREYTDKMKEHFQEKQKELQIKRKEAELMNLKIEHSKLDVIQQKRDQAMIQRYLAESYAKSIITKHEYLHMLKAEEIKEEQQKLSDMKKQTELQKQIKLVEQELYQSIAQSEIKRSEEKQQRELREKLQNRQEHQELMFQNEAREYIKEQNYKNVEFYKLTEENQKSLRAMHEKLVLTPNLRKEKETQEIIEKRIKHEQEKQFKNEIEKRRSHQEILLQTRNVIESQIDRKNMLKSYELEEKDRQIHERLMKDIDFDEYQKLSKFQQQEYRRNYKEFLDKQQLEGKDILKPNRMTLEEKKMNYFDPQAYRVNDPRTFALIPGLLSSKYSGPFRNQRGLPQRSPVRPTHHYLDPRVSYDTNIQNRDETSFLNQSAMTNSNLLEINKRQFSLPRLDGNSSFIQDTGNNSPGFLRNNQNSFAGNPRNVAEKRLEHSSPTKNVNFPAILSSHNSIPNPSRFIEDRVNQSMDMANAQGYFKRERNVQRRGVSQSNIFQN